MSYPNLSLTDDNANVYNFSPDFWITEDTIATNKNVINNSYAAGGRNIADGFLTARFITIVGQIRGDTLTQYESKYREFVKAVLKGGELRKTVDGVSRYIEVKNPDIQMGPEEGQKFKTMSIIFLAEDVFWKDDTETIDTTVVSGNATITVDNSNSDFLVFPKIEIEADQGVDVPGTLFRNNSDGGMSFTYNDPNFVENDIAVINSEEGTVKLNNGSRIEYFDGAFLRLQPDSNTIIYEGPACTIRIKWRKVYI